MSKPPRFASLAAHVELRRLRASERHRAHGRAAVGLTLLELRRVLLDLDREVWELEGIVAPIPEELPIKPGRRQFQLGAFKLDLFISGKKELHTLLMALKERRARLVGTEGRERVEQARKLETELLRQADALALPPAEQSTLDESLFDDGNDDEPPPITNGASRADRWW